MNGAGKKLWGWYPTGNVWVPLQVDANGKPVVDMSAITLDDLGDVSVPTPGDGYFVYRDAATSLWKCKALVAADIPNLDAAKITSGILAAARVGPKIQDADADTKVDVEESADEDKIRMDVKGVEAFLIHDDGIIDYPKQSAFKAYRTTSQSIPADIFTKIQCNVEDYDIQSEYDHVTNFRFTAKKAGTYLFYAANEFREMHDGKQLHLALCKNGVQEAVLWKLYNYIGTYPLGVGTAILVLAAGDYIEFWEYQGDTVASDSGQTIASCFFSGAKIA